MGSYEYIEVELSSCYNYAVFLSKLPQENGGFSNEENLMSVLKQITLNLSLESYHDLQNSSKRVEAVIDYAIRWLPFHLIQSERIDDAFNLLSSPTWIQHRINSTNIGYTSKIHANDCELFHYMCN